MLSDMVNEDSLVVKDVKTLIMSTMLFLANLHIHTQHVFLKLVQLLNLLSKCGFMDLSRSSPTSTSTGISHE